MARTLMIKFLVEEGKANGEGPFRIRAWSRGHGYRDIDLTGAFDDDPNTYAAMIRASKAVPRDRRDTPLAWPKMQYRVLPNGDITNIVIMSPPSPGTLSARGHNLPT